MVAEKTIFLSLSAILMVFLIFIFIGREALPVFLGHTDPRPPKSFPPPIIDKLSAEHTAPISQPFPRRLQGQEPRHVEGLLMHCAKKAAEKIRQ